MDEKPSSARPSLVVSAIENETLVETIYRPELDDTALVLATRDALTITAEWRSGGTVYVPVRPSNNLVKHGALLFPSEPAEYGDTPSLLAEISAYISRYVALSDQGVGISAAYVLLSWVYDAFNVLPYARYRGDYGTGKTRALLVVGSLCYKAFFASGASTVSPITRTLNSFQGTLIFDEADFRFSDEKAELTKILNSGHAKGFPMLRTQVTPQKEFNPQAFTIYGPKIVGMRRSYEDRALESRFLTIEMEPGKVAGAPINLPDEQKDEALALRNKLLMYRLRNRLSVKLDPSLADPALEPRMNQVLLPLLSVVPDEAARTMIREAAHSIQAGIIVDRGGTVEGQVLGVLRRLLAENYYENVSLTDIANAYAAEFEKEITRPITNRWIGSILRRLGILLYKSNGVFVLLPGQNERIKILCARYGIGESKEDRAA